MSGTPPPEAGGPFRVCAAVRDRLETLVPAMTTRIRRELPTYSRLPRDDHDRTVRTIADMLLDSLSHGTDPTADQLRAIQIASRRRSYYNLPVYDVLAAFHVVARDLWEELRRAADGDDGALLELVAPMWRWIQAMSSVVADAYTDDLGDRQDHEMALRGRLMELLRGGLAQDGRCRQTARQLGFDPTGRFQAFCSPAEHWPQSRLDLLQRQARQVGGVAACALHGELMIVLCQDVSAPQMLSRITGLGGIGTTVGVGLDREGLAGAELSTSDAARALRLAHADSDPVIDFQDCWLWAGLADNTEQLRPLYAEAERVGEQQPGLAEAVRAFCSQGFSLAGAAAALQVHPNTVAYRLSRWHTLTGLDPRTFPGLLRSVLALGRPGATFAVSHENTPGSSSITR